MTTNPQIQHSRRPWLRTAAALGIATSTMVVVAATGASSGTSASSSSDTRVLFVRGADRSGGFLEAGNNAQRTEHLADVANTSTSGGNHGWAEFATSLRGAGFVVEQVEEGAETPGPTAGQPVNFSTLGLDQYDLVIFGSNNAVHNTAHIDAVDDFVRDGGAALFISDANFGGSWQDAPNSDQQFLDRYGIVIHQDNGTYVINDNEYVAPSHPVLAGVSAFDGEGVSPFSVSGVNDDVALTVLAAAENQVRTNPGNAQGPTRSVNAGDAALWVAEVGQGRLAGHFDRNTFFNANGAGTNIGRFGNDRLARNLVAWLTGAGTGGPTTTVPGTTLPPVDLAEISDGAAASQTADRCDLDACDR